jgi:hypothetical protein
MPGPIPKDRISNGSVEAGPALCSRFYADGLQVVVMDDGNGTARVMWQSGEDKCDIIGMYVKLSRCQELDKTHLFQPLKSEGFLGVADEPSPDSRNRTPQKDSDKTTEAFAKSLKACRYGVGHPNPVLLDRPQSEGYSLGRYIHLLYEQVPGRRYSKRLKVVISFGRSLRLIRYLYFTIT